MTVPTDGRGPAVLEGGGDSRGRSEQQSAFNNDLSGSRLKPGWVWRGRCRRTWSCMRIWSTAWVRISSSRMGWMWGCGMTS